MATLTMRRPLWLLSLLSFRKKKWAYMFFAVCVFYTWVAVYPRIYCYLLFSRDGFAYALILYMQGFLSIKGFRVWCWVSHIIDRLLPERPILSSPQPYSRCDLPDYCPCANHTNHVLVSLGSRWSCRHSSDLFCSCECLNVYWSIIVSCTVCTYDIQSFSARRLQPQRANKANATPSCQWSAESRDSS